MKVIIGILASENENYNKLKQVWIKNILKVKNSHLSEIFDFYFLYSDTQNEHQKINSLKTGNLLYIDFYDKTDNLETIYQGMFYRSISFFEHLIKSSLSLKNKEVFVIRTNLSTLFNFNLLYRWFENKPNENFFGGSFIKLYYNENLNDVYPIISGTNLTFSFDIITYLVNNKNKINISNFGDDEAISHFIMQNLNVFTINMKRLDFVEYSPNESWGGLNKCILYHKCKKNDEDIFTFRFKTFDRDNDVKNMLYFMSCIWNNNYNLNNVIKSFSKHIPSLPIIEEYPEFSDLYSNIPFKKSNILYVSIN